MILINYPNKERGARLLHDTIPMGANCRGVYVDEILIPLSELLQAFKDRPTPEVLVYLHDLGHTLKP